MIDNGKLKAMRDKLNLNFLSFANNENSEITYDTDNKSLDLLSRLYDEERSDRRINIDYDQDTTLPINGFVKLVGLNNNIELLTIVISDNTMNLEQLWKIRKAWMDRRENVDTIESMFDI
ncbi:MAG TPA: hypothetical protein VGF77_09420 [Allosphingosinicella sp.]